MKLTHVGTEGNELADRMAMLGVQSKKKKRWLYQKTMDIPTLLKMRADEKESVSPQAFVFLQTLYPGISCVFP